MYGFLFRGRWIAFHLLVVVAVVGMVNAGFWQLRRLDQRQSFNAVIEARYDADAVPLDELLPPGGDDDLEEIEWRQATASGTYLPEEQLRVVNRSQGGRAGDNVVVPLALDDGRILLVNRGFVPLAEPPVETVDGRATVTGHLRTSEERRLGQLADPSDGELTEVQRIDVERLAPQLPGEPVPMYLDLIASTPAQDGAFPEPVARPDLSEGNHLSYAVQWFIFSIAVAAGWFLAVRRSQRARERSRAKELDEPADVARREPAAH